MKSNIKNLNIVDITKSALMGVMVSMIGVLIFAIVIRFVTIGDNVVTPVNEAIKAISIFAAVLYFARKSGGNLFVKSILIGVVYSVLSYLIFSALSGVWSMDMGTLYDVLFSIITAIISAMLLNVMRKKN